MKTTTALRAKSNRRDRIESGTPPDPTLPARWGRWQRVKNTLIYGLVRAAANAWRAVPQSFVPILAQGVGRLAALVAQKERRLAEEQLRQAFPDWPSTRQKQAARGMFVHLAESALELGHLPALLRGPCAVEVSPAARAVFDAAFAEGRGVVGVTGHIGNWELLAQVIAAAGYPIHTIAKPLYDPRLTRWVHDLRTAGGLQVIWRGSSGGAKEMLRVFRQGGMLALLIDQDTDVDGVFVPFFGRAAHTPSAAAALALRFQAPVVVAWLHRLHRPGEIARHVLHVERLHYMCSPDRAADLRALTAQMTARLEGAVRAQPEQWVWLHRRWKRQPLDIV